MQAPVPSMALPSAASRGASGKQCVVRSVDAGPVLGVAGDPGESEQSSHLSEPTQRRCHSQGL